MVGVEHLRAFYGAIVKTLHPEDKLLFITTSVFSQDAENFARQNHIQMINYKELEKQINIISQDLSHKAQIDLFLSKIDYSANKKYNQNIKTCPICGAPLKWRKEGFYGCQNYFKTGCKYIEPGD